MARPASLPIVLLHGCGGSAAETYVRTGWVERLAASGRTVVPVTLPGHGVGASHDPAAYADLAGAVLADLPPQFDGIGFSLGGKLLLEVAARAPDRVGRLVIGGVGDNAFAPEKSGEASAAALADGIGPNSPPPLRSFYASCIASGVDLLAIAAILRRSPNPVLDADRLSRVTAPVLLVNGDADPIATPAGALMAALAQVQPVTLPGIDHLSLPANADFLRHALAFLEDSK
ncbi:alpha/beta fold hydrolase [Novosphingobium lentum]|uniref:alpha/beta fold hydrolase n=1 Tax=Novosphingobium lentum TaxID=145287 RepID=UPI00146FF79E|nr:alpha/beta hydrolase [Novosphingobium lentum]